MRTSWLLILALAGGWAPSHGQMVLSGEGPNGGSWQAMAPTSQSGPWSDGLVGTGLLLRRLDGVKRVLLIGAHPDDEDTALLAALSRGLGAETAYLSLTRGEGGQNLIGAELDEGLGLIRTGELLAARTLDGGRQYFTRAFDFGYSKTAEETFRYWPREEILRDVTWVIRTFRPQVVVAVFSGTSADGHGHHQVAGIIAREAFDVAGDPTRFADQIEAGAPAWTPLKLYRLTRRAPQEGTTGIETGSFDPILGRSYFQIAMESRSMHRSQDMGTAQPLGPRRSTVALLESRVNRDGPDEIFAGVDTALVALAPDLPDERRQAVLTEIGEYREAIAQAKEALNLSDPWKATPPLGKALGALRHLLASLDGSGPDGASTEAGGDLARSLRERLPLLEEALVRSAGVVVDVRMDRDLLVPGETATGTLELWNGGPFPLNGVSWAPAMPEGWEISGDTARAESVEAGAVARWRFQLHPPQSADPSRAFYLAEEREGELYQWPRERGLWGESVNPDLFNGRLAFTIGDHGDVDVGRPGLYRGVDKASGEFVRPVQVVPALAVSLDPSLMVWPSDGREVREFRVTLKTLGDRPLEGTVGLGVPENWRVSPQSVPFSLPGSGGEAVIAFAVTRPEGAPDGLYDITARARTSDGEGYSAGVTLVDYPHIRRGILFPEARSRVSVFPVAMPVGLRVGYVMGSGDGGVGAIRQMGAEVDLLGAEDLRSGDLGRFDAVVLGIRAYETRPDLAAANDRLLDYARKGGTVIAQYNKYEYPRGGFAPFEVEMSRPHDRVTDETVPVRILDSSHPILVAPNTIGPGDFEGWVQERGLYYLSSWDPAFQPLLAMSDPGEDPKEGGLLVARVGEGFYVYTGLAFFRQFPEGVPGAYRLFANLVSLKAGGVD